MLKFLNYDLLIGFLSLLFFFLSLFNQNFLIFWIIYELGNLVLIPLFLTNSYNNINSFYPLMLFLILSGLGASLLFLFLVNQSFVLLFYLFLSFKVGLFPFSLWLININISLSWMMNYLILGFSKLPLLVFFGNIFNFNNIVLLVCFSLLVNSLFMWQNPLNLKVLICCNFLNSGYIFLFFLNNSSFVSLLLLIIVFLFNGFLISYVCNVISNNSNKWLNNNWLIFLFLCFFFPIPITLGLVYKFINVNIFLFANNFIFILVWVLVSIMEILYVYNLYLKWSENYFFNFYS
nr:NADH dehydrogenase subunit 2 [Rhabdosynochus viridisi]